MTLRTWLTQRLQPALAPSQATEDVMAVCDSCRRTERRTADGAAPAGWFQLVSVGQLLCPDCLAPVVDQVGRAWSSSNAGFLARHPSTDGTPDRPPANSAPTPRPTGVEITPI